MKDVLALIGIVLCTHALAYSQSTIPDNYDKQASELIAKIVDWHHIPDTSSSYEIGDSLTFANDQFEIFLRTICGKMPMTISLPLTEQKGLHEILSSDKKVKVYSWDSWLGGSMHRYGSFAAYETNQGIKTESILILDDSVQKLNGTHYSEGGYQFNKISLIMTKSGKIIYLIFGSSIESTRDRGEIVLALEIVDGHLSISPNFKTNSKDVGVINYSFGTVVANNLPTMHLSKNQRKLYIPIVSGAFKDEVTSKYLVYVFDGYNFVFDKNAK